MRLSRQEQLHLDDLLSKLRDDKKVLEMKKYIQHGSISTYDHVESVTRVSYWMNRRFHLGANEKRLVIGAFLHDFYLYDWHEKSDWHKWHGFSHPFRAAGNAHRIFHIGKRERQIIESHMWPLTLRHVPETREAAIVCIADKCCSFYETVRR